jgi:hypothetical protein
MTSFTVCESGCTSVTSSSTDATPSDNAPGTVTSYTLDNSCNCCGSDCVCPDDLPSTYTVSGDYYQYDPTCTTLELNCHFSFTVTLVSACTYQGSGDDCTNSGVVHGTWTLQFLASTGDPDIPCTWSLTTAENGAWQHTANPNDPTGVYDIDANWTISTCVGAGNQGQYYENVTVS